MRGFRWRPARRFEVTVVITAMIVLGVPGDRVEVRAEVDGHVPALPVDAEPSSGDATSAETSTASIPARSASLRAPALATAPFVHVAAWSIPPRLGGVVDVDVAPDGTTFLADALRHAVLVVDIDGRVVQTLGAPPKLGISGSALVPMAVEFEPGGGTLAIVWQRFGKPPGTTSEALREAYLERWSIDGAEKREAVRLIGGGGVPVTDLTRRPAAGDLVAVLGGALIAVSEEDPAGRLVLNRPASGAHPERIAPLGSRFVAVGGGSAWWLESDGRVRAIDLGSEGRTAVDVVGGDSGGFFVLLHGDGKAVDPDVPLIFAFDADGKRLPGEDLDVADVHVPPPPSSGWPWAVARAGDHVVVTSHLADGGVVASRAGPAPVMIFGMDDAVGTAPIVLAAEASVESKPGVIAIAPSPAGGAIVLTCEGEHAPVNSAEGCTSMRSSAYRLGARGEVRDGVPLGPTLADAAVSADGSVFVGFAGGHTRDRRRTPIEPHIARLGEAWTGPSWTLPCECWTGARLALSAGSLFATSPMSRTLQGFDTSTRTITTTIPKTTGGGVWPGDVTSLPGGEIIAADTGRRLLERWAADGRLVGGWSAGGGIAFGPRRVASGLWRGETVVGALTSDGQVEIHDVSRGELVARWLPEGPDGSTPEWRDIAFDTEGRLLLAEWNRGDVHVFEPIDGPWEPATPTPGPTPSPPPDACSIEVSKVADPTTIVLGETTGVSLGFSAACPPREGESIGADVILIVVPGGDPAFDVWNEKFDFVARWLALVDFGSHRVGAVSRQRASPSMPMVPLGSSPSEILAALRSIDPSTATSSNPSDLAIVARDMLDTDGREGALRVIVLVGGGWHVPGLARLAADAADARAAGILTYAIEVGSKDYGLEAFAGSPSRTFQDPSPSDAARIMAHVVREAGLSLSGNLVIDDTMSDDVWYEEDSALPPAIVGSGVSDLRWARSVIPSTGLSLTYRVRPLRVGHIPTNRSAVARYDDVDGTRREIVFPIPYVDVVAPSPTPTSEPTPATVSGPIFLPLAVRGACVREKSALDIALAIDVSSSMAGEKLGAAKMAALAFVGALDLAGGRDRAAVIAFDDSAIIAAPLTTEATRIERAIEGLSAGTGTRLDRALDSAAIALGPAGERRAGAVSAIILLSDGAHGGPAAEVVLAAESARGMTGAAIWTIGLGPDADADLLRAVAEAGAYRFAPGAAALEAVYSALTEEVGCR